MSEKKCVLCNEIVELKEYQQLADEFKPYPVHGECFDTFVNADEFLEFASNQAKDSSQSNKMEFRTEIQTRVI